MITSRFKRVFWIVLDGVGVGELPDAAQFHDQGANSIGHLRAMKLPHLEAMGLGHLTKIQGLSSSNATPHAAFAKATEISAGKDTTTGHWEMVGIQTLKAFKTFPNGFDDDIISKWVTACKLPGVLGNKAASGTDIIDELGPEHMKSGKPILYTSADSVWQVAAHEEAFGLDRLMDSCKVARKLCDEIGIGRVIARPFVGDPSKGIPFKRTYHRKDLSVLPPSDTYLDQLVARQIPVIGVGKISNIFAGRGVTSNIDTEGNEDGMRRLIEVANREKGRGLYYCNLIDFDMLYGHRRNAEGYAHCLEDFDQALGGLLSNLDDQDLLIINSDHGNDPTYRGTDHTREYIPVIAHSNALKKTGVDLGTLSTFADSGATVFEALSGEKPTLLGQSFLKKIL